MPRSSGKKHISPQSLNAAVKSICDIMRRSNCAGALQYVPELTWILFLRILDEHEIREAEEAEALGVPFTPTLTAPFRWRDWAAPGSAMREDTNASVWKFVHEQLLAEWKTLNDKPGTTSRQKVVSEIMSSVDRSQIDSEKNFLDVLDKVHEISSETVDQTHVFTLSEVYEGLLLKMGERGNDGGQFFTPREVIRAMVRVVDPQIGKTVYDPGCGTAGFLAQSYDYMREEAGDGISAVDLDTLKHRTFYGREKDNAVYPIALANLMLHGIDEPHVWHGNSLSQIPVYAGLFVDAPQFFDCVLMNPPFGGKEQARPLRERAAEIAIAANRLDDDVAALRKVKVEASKIQQAQERLKSALREVREIEAKAVAIENSVYDLKAVNPFRQVEEDTRTPAEIVAAIADKGREADAALSRLRSLISEIS